MTMTGAQDGMEMGTTMTGLEMWMHLESWLVRLHFYILFTLLSNNYLHIKGLCVRKWELRQQADEHLTTTTSHNDMARAASPPQGPQP